MSLNMKAALSGYFWITNLIVMFVEGQRSKEELNMEMRIKMEEIPIISAHLTKTLKTYDKRLRPNAGGEPVEITAEFKVGSVGEINEAEMSYSMDIFFRHWWVDPRLTSNFTQPITLSMDASSIIWIPDTYFLNSKKSEYHQVIGDCMRLILWPNGSIYYSVRISVVLRCDMDLRLYPFDTQQCPFIVESHAYTKDDVLYKWNNRRSTQGIEVASNHTAQFILLEAKLRNTLVEKVAGTYSTLFATFSFKRRSEFFIMTVFAPATILTLMSWCSLWISVNAIPARISLCITTILSIILLTSTANSHMPKVSYMKAMDTYLLGCLTFIFMTLVEFVIVLNTPSNNKPTGSDSKPNPDAATTQGTEETGIEPRNKTHKNEERPLQPNFRDFSRLDGESGLPVESRDSNAQATNQRKEDQSLHYIDTASRVLFPLMFVMFVGIFFVWYFV